MSSKRPTGDPLPWLIEQTRRRVLRLEQKLTKQQDGGRFSLVTASEPYGPFGPTGWHFLSTPWAPHGQPVNCIGLWAAVGVVNPSTQTTVVLRKNGVTQASVSIPVSSASASASCGVAFTPQDLLTFRIGDNGGSWQELTVYAVLASPDQSAGLDFNFYEGDGGG